MVVGWIVSFDCRGGGSAVGGDVVSYVTVQFPGRREQTWKAVTE